MERFRRRGGAGARVRLGLSCSYFVPRVKIVLAMSKITKEQVEKVAKLARLNLTPDELNKFADQLSSIFEHVDILSEVDTDGTQPTSQVTGLTNVMRDDEVDSDFCSKDELLAVTPLPVERGQIKVKKVL
ncbi:Asp-tRNA(Asn)/Glu-tRNA(Gln) amidotransferase GatCAB subunit C [Candidatus Peregrinibacteria bacterium CG22_combo_CG10-13_8_21_14_all_44_10]|nr:MAG: Asp-tRNA(Asn)/Glu-tRNA(Gln) amidotransferase GatCAB subunit C [Candidatus Peregrinibacteria bacterium CG22_combo_CG10-13_8_21_14_all_44_10]PIX80088.1 MAG: Asp-tRNA(Asn)/Glu-tRNA(Gln) amidotransferase GatCAB subunit C [Candidatus Peregrinibacteria bacterium CG_4_10_14_3_um_filter_44_21]PJB89140.1 MAG: Asp-tRNA(Asn)/Glu-tRNA(Gln) amidotransferase GatCAB subunit C [Candidatus Peregrinibacteria bacterium CG_4_9_14_0_8_um_filter_44_15]